ncbi:hypothetical protein ABFS83_14G054300 [Erythranthe nasuta]
MAKTRNASRLEEQAKERGRIGESSTGNQELGSDNQENRSDGSGFTLPSKKHRFSELEDDEIPPEKNSAPSNKNQDSELEDQIPQQKLPPTGAGSRYCFKKTLNEHAVNPESARLYLDEYEASTIIKRLKIVGNTQNSRLHPRGLVVFDEVDRRWEMLLSQCTYGGKVCYKLGGEWREFVATHNLRNGEKIAFYKNLDKTICDDHYYIIKTAARKRDGKKADDVVSTE